MENRIIIVPERLLRKIDENRDNLSRAEFIELCINACLEGKTNGKEEYITKNDFRKFQEEIRELIGSVMEIFLNINIENVEREGKKRELQKGLERLLLGSD